MHIHPSITCAVVGLIGLVAAPLLSRGPGAITLLAAAVALIVAVGLGVSGYLLARPRVASAGAGLVLGALGLAGVGLFAAQGSVGTAPATVEAADEAR